MTNPLRTRFEALATCSFNFQRSPKGTYVNPATARDWKWFQLGVIDTIIDAAPEAIHHPDCHCYTCLDKDHPPTASEPVNAAPAGEPSDEQILNVLNHGDANCYMLSGKASDHSVLRFARAVLALYTAPAASPEEAPANWQSVIKRARDGLAAGSRSTSNTDFEVEYGGALIESIEEGLERLAPAASLRDAEDAKPVVTESNVGRYCLSEDDCIADGINFAAYERGIADAAAAFGRNRNGR